MTTTQIQHRAQSATASPAISLTGLTKSFGSVHAVRGIDLTIQRGEVVTFLGTGSLFAHTRPVDEVLAAAGLTEVADRTVGKCSGGEQQRLRFAMSLISDPELILLDEPTTGMDVASRRAFWENIHADARAGRTVVFATHYLEEADQYADRVVLVRKGQIVADGTAAEIRALGAGRSVRATWPGASADALHGIPGVESVDILGDTVTIRAADSDAVARHLLTATPARDLEITARGLEDAFVALTGDDAADDTAQEH